MRLTLYTPGLLLPKAVLADTVFDLNAPSLALMLGRGRRFDLRRDWLAAAFGQSAPLPAGVLRKVGAGETADGPFICLDPVHFAVKREGILLADPAELDLNASEATALIAAVQPLFSDWGTLSASRPAQWELQLSRSLLLDTRPPDDAIGLPVDPALPGGPDGSAWRRLLAEAQTILHAHPVNRQREAKGQPIINSLWPWGFGSLPEAPHAADFEAVWSDDTVLAGLCTRAGISCAPPPAAFQLPTRDVFCQVDQLRQPAQAMDALGWRQGLLAIEQDWLAPALAALKRGECQSVRLIGTGVHGAERAVVYRLVRSNFLRFWRRPAPLVELASTP